MALQFGSGATTDGAALFRQLRDRKFPSRYAMSAALIGSISNISASETADWMIQLHEALKIKKLHNAARHTTSIALASITDAPAEEIAADVVAYSELFKKGLFKSSRADALALNFVNTIRIANTKDFHKGNDMTTLVPVITALQAYRARQEQAAATAAITGGVVAATASS